MKRVGEHYGLLLATCSHSVSRDLWPARQLGNININGVERRQNPTDNNNIDKELELTPRLLLFGRAEYDTHEMWKESAGLNYTIAKSLSLILLWHSEYHWGAGVQIRF